MAWSTFSIKRNKLDDDDGKNEITFEMSTCLV